MEVKIRQTHRNLLTNSLTARLRRSNDDRAVNQSPQNHSRSQSTNHIIQINGLNVRQGYDVSPRDQNRAYESSSKQDGASPRSIQKQTVNHRNRTDRERSVLFDLGVRARSDLSSVSLLPRLVGSESSMSQSPVKEDFQQFAFIDKDDLSHVKVFKLKGVFQPQNKYFNKIEPIEISEKPKLSTPETTKEIDVKSPRVAEERNESVSPYDQPKSRMSRMSRKGLRVSWSRRSQYYSADEEDDEDGQIVNSSLRTEKQLSKPDNRADSRTENTKSPSSVKSQFSMKSDSYFVKKRFPGKHKLDSYGLKWAIPPPSDVSTLEETIRKPVRTKIGSRSHNLTPVTSGLDKTGRSSSKMRWKVQSSESLRKSQSYQNWVDQLVDLKAGRLESYSEKIPNRAHLSVMTQPVK